MAIKHCDKKLHKLNWTEKKLKGIEELINEAQEDRSIYAHNQPTMAKG